MAGRSRSRLAFFFLIAPLLFGSCQNSPTLPSTTPKEHFRGFYHWTTHFSLDTKERTWLDSLQVDRLYVKFFDIDWDPESASPIPLASVQLDTSGLQGRQVIPTLFITNRSMLQIADADIPQLAERIVTKIDGQFGILDQPLREIQLDCDWTPDSRSHYFSLLEQLRARYQDRGVALSATIRLHQLRYPDRTGIPPVDGGVLMFYNMGDLQDWSETNSILNLKKAAAYLPAGLTYPLHLDLALPLFRWAVLFREGRMVNLINEPDEISLNQSDYYRSLGTNRYEVLQSTYLDGYYLYRGDQLRVESVSTEALQAALQLVRTQYPPAGENVIFYHLDSAVVRRYEVGEIEALMQSVVNSR